MKREDVTPFIRKNLISVVSGGVALVLVVIIYLRSDVGPAAEEALTQRTAEGERLESNIENAAQLKEQFAALVEANKEIDQRMVHVGQLAQNLQYFYKLESDTRTKLMELRQGGVTPVKGGAKGTYTPVSFNVTVQGDYPSIIDFLRRLETGVHFARIETCSLVPGPNPAGPGRGGPMVLTLTLDLLSLP